MFKRIFLFIANFNPRSPRGGATNVTVLVHGFVQFQSTLPTRGSDKMPHCSMLMILLFQSTLPTRGSDEAKMEIKSFDDIFQSTLPTRGSDSLGFTPHQKYLRISIHAPHEGERQRKSAFVCSISANLLNIIHCGTVTRAVSRRRIALFRLFSVRRSGVFTYAYASH